MGLFLTVEGPDGAGKTTQIELLRDYLSDKGYDIIVCREPGGTPISEAVRNVILNKEFTEMGHMTELLLYAAARAQLIEEVIRPALEDGKIVICDRFVESSAVYQGIARGMGIESKSICNRRYDARSDDYDRSGCRSWYFKKEKTGRAGPNGKRDN